MVMSIVVSSQRPPERHHQGGEGPRSRRSRRSWPQRRGASEQTWRRDYPCVILAASGICSGGRILNYLKALIEQDATDIVFVGYQANGSLGRRLVDGADEVRIHARDEVFEERVDAALVALGEAQGGITAPHLRFLSSGGSLEGVRTSTVTSCPAARHCSKSSRPTPPVAPNRHIRL